MTAEHQDQDLIVAAPAWADPVLRLRLGDLIPPKMAGRLDHQRFSRVWELSQRGAEAPEADGARVKAERRFGRLRVRLLRTPSRWPPTYDFVDNWADARVFRVENGPPAHRLRGPGRTSTSVPGIGHNFVQRRILEIGGSCTRRCTPSRSGGATVVVEYPGVLIGRELAVGAGLHNVWAAQEGRRHRLAARADRRPGDRQVRERQPQRLAGGALRHRRAGRALGRGALRDHLRPSRSPGTSASPRRPGAREPPRRLARHPGRSPLGLFVLTVGWLLSVEGRQGIGRDEAQYFRAAERYWGWFEELGRNLRPGASVTRCPAPGSSATGGTTPSTRW